jgi:hypothetical protein
LSGRKKDMAKNSDKKIKTSCGFYCSKKCPYWEPKGFTEYCSAYKKTLDFNSMKDLSKRCGPCLLDYPTKKKDNEEVVK